MTLCRVIDMLACLKSVNWFTYNVINVFSYLNKVTMMTTDLEDNFVAVSNTLYTMQSTVAWKVLKCLFFLDIKNIYI